MTEREVEERLAAMGLPDDMDEVLLEGGAVPDEAAMERIRQMTLVKAGSTGAVADGAPAAAGSAPAPTPAPRPRPWRQRLWAAAAAIALVGIGATVVLGPAEVLARLLSYVPGLGLRDPAEVKLAAARPVRLTRGDQWVEVRGLLADATGVTVNVVAFGPSLTTQGVTVLDGGHRLPPGGASVGAGGAQSDGWYRFEGKLAPETRRLTVLVDGAEPWRFEVEVIPGSQLLPADQFGPSAHANGYSIAARARLEEDRVDLNMLVQGTPMGSHIRGMERYFGTGAPATRPLEVTVGGRRLRQLPGSSNVMGELSSRSYEAVPAGSLLTVTVPLLEVEETGSGKVTVPMQAGPIDKQVTLGRWTLTLLRAEEEGDGIRIYVDPGPHLASSLSGFDELLVNGRVTSWNQSYDEETGRIDSFWVPTAVLRGSTVTLTLKQPIVTVEGPWVIEVPVQK